MKYVNLLIEQLKNLGLKKIISKSISKLLPFEIYRRKNKILKHLNKKFNYTVPYGPFKGMKLNSDRSWSSYDLVTQYLGVYEEHVLEKIINFSKKNSTFIDIGAADGYFVVGLAHSQIYKYIYAFEINKRSRSILKKNIAKNNCYENITIKNEANLNEIKEILKTNISCTILIDIEGSEFDFLNSKMLNLMKNCSIICELHPFFVKNGSLKQKELIKLCSEEFDTYLIQREIYNPNNFDCLNNFNDDERLLCFSESRFNNQQWLVLEPKYKK